MNTSTRANRNRRNDPWNAFGGVAFGGGMFDGGGDEGGSLFVFIGSSRGIHNGGVSESNRQRALFTPATGFEDLGPHQRCKHPQPSAVSSSGYGSQRQTITSNIDPTFRMRFITQCTHLISVKIRLIESGAITFGFDRLQINKTLVLSTGWWNNYRCHARDRRGYGAITTLTPFPSGGGPCHDGVLGSWPQWASSLSVRVRFRLKMVEAVTAEVRGVECTSTRLPTPIPAVTATCIPRGTSFLSKVLLQHQFLPQVLLLRQLNLQSSG